jgi:hypothetical protein
MKLSEYLPEVPAYAKQLSDLNSQLNMFQLSKAAGETGSAPTIGLDHVVNTWVRHQMAYRQQLVMDLQTICMTVEEIRSPLNHITSEVFRRGMKWKALVQDADPEQIKVFTEFIRDCNVFDQSLEEVLRQFHFDVNSIDDGFIYIAKEYYSAGDGTLKSKVKEIRRLNPALVEFDLDTAGLPKNAHFLCPIHRTEVKDDISKCEEPGCDRMAQPVMYKYYHRNQQIYLFDSEVIHLTKFAPSETYGWSPILTIFEKALTLIGMDKNLYRYFFERKMPASMVMVTTDDPESLRRERANIAAQTRLDPNFIPMVAVSARSQRGRVDMVRLFHTLQEMDYLPVREEIRERVGAMWGVTPAWQGAPEAFGGLSTQTQQLVVMSRVVEADQRMFHEKIFPLLLEAFGITDWELELPQPEEKAEATKISFAQQKVQVANTLAQLGFTVALKEQQVDLGEMEFIISGDQVPTAQMQGEQQAMEIAGQEQQFQMQQMQAEQQNQMIDQAQQQANATGEPIEVDVGAAGGAEGGGEAAGGGGAEGGGAPIQAMLLKGKGKYKGRTGGITPDASMKLPGEERDIDEYAEARQKKGENKQWGIKEFGGNPLNKTWIGSLMEKGYSSPVVKEIMNNQMWFIQDGVDYVATLGNNGVTNVEKAQFKPTGNPTRPSVSYAPSGRNNRNTKNSSSGKQGERYQGETIDEDELEGK